MLPPKYRSDSQIQIETQNIGQMDVVHVALKCLFSNIFILKPASLF